ncbi:MAG: 1,2-dihydroxy-3-keto-5-methylthiopentene dioxygenase [Kiritimatiellia bacterium]|jgi:1,2-dihydroxy-3-keto-5-methylthiopentene dioxygenase
MAKLFLEDGSVVTDFDTVAATLRTIGYNLQTWSVGDDEALAALLQKDALSTEEKEQVLDTLDHYFQTLKTDKGYAARDLVVLHPAIPGLDEKLKTFATPHTHTDDEVRYVIDGDGVFGLVLSDGEQAEIMVERQEYLSVPANAEHWFRLSSSKRIKCIRYFAENPVWQADFTETKIRITAGA